MRTIVIVAALAWGCGNDAGDPAPYDYAASKGAALYQQMCQVCHGEAGEGGLGPKLSDTSRNFVELQSVIEQRMPQNNPGQCTGDCAIQVAEFIQDGLSSSALRCDAIPPGPRRLRLLTRREYRATVVDLFGDTAPVMACAKQTDCAFHDTCEAGTCQPTACDAQTFAYDPQGHTFGKVHVAGSFNSWAGTVAAGGLPLAYSPTTGLWTGTFSIGEGMHQYKLVLDESQWIVDPRAPSSVPDGFGGQNSAFTLACSGAVASDPVAGFPAENRPSGFPFDDDADSALVTSTHVDAYLATAEQLADFGAAHQAELHPCNWGSDASCGHGLVADLGKRLFRRTLTPDELAHYQALVDGTDGVATAIQALLMSPSFVYRSELGVQRGAVYRLTGYELAAALSYTFLGTTPGSALLAAADAGELDTSEGLERWARTLVADPRARDQLGEFALQWVGGQNVLTTDKRADLFPELDAPTRLALANETRNFAADVAFDGSGRLDDLFTANYTVLDATAASFYGVAGTGHVMYAYGRRAGVLGHASVLATTAHSDQTSPILRGLFIRRNLLCEELPPPPPFAGAVPSVDATSTTRQRFAMHTANPVCASCHGYIDNIGFGLEHFDPIGRWRDTDNGMPIDPSGDANDLDHLGAGTSSPYTTLPELAQAIADSAAAPSCFARQYLRFSRGIRETLAQRCDRLSLEAKFADAKHDLRELMVQSVLASDFVERRP